MGLSLSLPGLLLLVSREPMRVRVELIVMVQAVVSCHTLATVGFSVK